MAELNKEKFQIIGCDDENLDGILRPSITFWQDAWRRLKKNKIALVSLGIIVFVIIMSIIGPHLRPYVYSAVDQKARNMSPNAQHWFGTDSLGRDMFVRVWRGARISVFIGVIGTAIEFVIGMIYGGISGYFGGIVDDIMMRIVEILISIPYLILVILMSLVFGRGLFSLIIAMTITGWCGVARMVRGQLLQIKEQEFVLASKALGANPSRVIVKHLLPNTMGILIVGITLDVPALIFSEAFLSYLGLGISSPEVSLGSLAAEARQQFRFYPYQLLYPSLVISLIMLAFNLFGDGLRDALDPRLRQ